MTKQRQAVYDTLMAKLDHPTASEVYDRTKEHMPTISMATVYNCLETLTQCGLVKQVNLDRAPSGENRVNPEEKRPWSHEGRCASLS